jgi:hypothetical protein
MAADFGSLILEEYLKRPGAVARMQQFAATFDVYLALFRDLCLAVGGAINYVANLRPSPGYEAMLASRGFNTIGARGLAYLTVRVGKRVARESSWRRPAYDAMRFLALPSRQSRAVIPRAKLLLSVWNETSIIETVFEEAGLDETEFVNLLRTIAEGRHAEGQRLATIAATVSPWLSLPRGPKVSAPSAAYEFARTELRLPRAKGRRSLRMRSEEYVDELTEATRREFDVPHFDSRPARRRIRRRRKADPWPESSN